MTDNGRKTWTSSGLRAALEHQGFKVKVHKDRVLVKSPTGREASFLPDTWARKRPAVVNQLRGFGFDEDDLPVREVFTCEACLRPFKKHMNRARHIQSKVEAADLEHVEVYGAEEAERVEVPAEATKAGKPAASPVLVRKRKLAPPTPSRPRQEPSAAEVLLEAVAVVNRRCEELVEAMRDKERENAELRGKLSRIEDKLAGLIDEV